MNPEFEVVFAENSEDVLRDRYEQPLYFIVGGADNEYLSNLVGQPIESLVQRKTVDPIPFSTTISSDMYGVYASRFLLPNSGYARTFPLSTFLEPEWPILRDIESGKFVDNNNSNIDKIANNLDVATPPNVLRVWIIRALRRAGQNDLAEEVRKNMLKEIYPEKLPLESIPAELSLQSLAQLYLDLSEEQRNYPLTVLVDSLPVSINKTLGEVLSEISLTRCTQADLRAIQTSIELLSYNQI